MRLNPNATKTYQWERYRIDERIPMSVNMVQGKRATTLPHRHDFEELLLVVGGTGTYTTSAEICQLEAGDLFLVHTGEVHSFTNQHDLVVYNLLYQLSKLPFDFGEYVNLSGYQALFREGAADSRQNHHLHLDAKQLDQTKDLIEQIHEELVEHREGYETAVCCLFKLLFVVILRPNGKAEDRRQRNFQKIANVLHYLSMHYDKPLNRPLLAQIANMSQATFFRHFLQATRMSPRDYLQNLRLNEAEELLRNTNLTLADISSRCGFYDNNHFILCFRKRFNMPPARYRKLFHDKAPYHDA
ncbi:MAG: helix-turn-helix domain-containing protein [Victivallales bacterium]|nr:helix-turn-helix domain-containing protein [Victivallales bacterium]